MKLMKSILKIVVAVALAAPLVGLAGCRDDHRHGMSYHRPARFESPRSSHQGGWDSGGHGGGPSRSPRHHR